MSLGAEIPVVFLTHDGDGEVASTVINSWQRLWFGGPLRFLIPVQSDRQRNSYTDSIEPSASFQLVDTEAELRATVTALCRTALACRGAEWFLWATSDRCPVALAEDLKSGVLLHQLPRDICSLRLTLWKDSSQLEANATRFRVGDAEFRCGRMLFHGFWHPQIVSREYVQWLEGVWSRGPLNVGIREWQPHLESEVLKSDFVCCYPEQNLAKFDEPTIKGRPTISYAVKRAHLEKPLPRQTKLLPALAAGFGNPYARNVNYFWSEPKKDLTAEDVPGWKFPDLPATVVSFGGCGSKMVVNWLYRGAKVETKRLAHCHKRIPPANPPPGVVFYVFGDPRNSIHSFFQRRETITSKHGFTDAYDQPPLPRPSNRAWCLAALRYLESLPEDMDNDWDLERYLTNGIDLFRLEEHFDMWIYSPLNYPVYFIKYEGFWNSANIIQSVAGVHGGPAPEKRERRADWTDLPHKLRGAIDAMNGSFARRLAKLPDCFMVQNGGITDLRTQKLHKLDVV